MLEFTATGSIAIDPVQVSGNEGYKEFRSATVKVVVNEVDSLAADRRLVRRDSQPEAANLFVDDFAGCKLLLQRSTIKLRKPFRTPPEER